ncbi:Large-conductance mechanosensitive channel [Wohlfahrtiimonas chitiniclastica SH04]|uniref:Large-conductance mechanosensitive channel n=1 Tax=Wohlfahrtiimonas chitiniclastica SH04 TaxID=1261130 RepID=L8XYT9_9GAMM|nr:large conductance mechanosensitive channel protein MscL [Wohlfahrtiimonas chitiniclastica]ELV09072.1 Large-conductance mechanosensitive channel [Wohlfahrtiimonas chitiniclastica SH04]MBS7838405.1 large conductance mechanosensitive channel protein MscL [Wohlfahrtiimonas chitiniclastica]OYQ76628.1 mechanosensitive ion channel protein MscL [Wohlfahrtiimonas chitiniclastica]
MFKEFKKFLLRGNILDLSVGVVIGTAFTAIVNKIVEGLLTPIISLIFVLTTGKTSADDALGNLVFQVQGVTFNVGAVLSALITFFITAIVLFIIMKTANKIMAAAAHEEQKQAEEAPKAPPAPTSEDYLKEIRDLLAKQAEQK